MPAVSIDLNMVRVTNDEFVKKAEACTPKLIETVVRPVAIVDIVKTEEIFPEVHKRDEIENLSSCHLAKGDKNLPGFRRSSGRLCDSETEFRRKSAGCTGVFQTEIR